MTGAAATSTGVTARTAGADFQRDVIRGLRNSPRRIPPKYFYDEYGSRLFEEICKQPEYYPTRTECSLLGKYAHEIAELTGPGCCLIEPGSGNCEKVRLLLDALQPDTYIPVDISGEHLQAAAGRLATDFPWVSVRPVCADITDSLELPAIAPDTSRLLFYPGSSIGNFEPHEARSFLETLARIAGRGGAMLIGVDLQKSPHRLTAAYNDANGITAAFNLNLLRRISRELDASLDIDAFEHYAFYNTEEHRIEMHLVSNSRQTIRVNGHRFELEPGDQIHTENSYKYTIGQFQSLAAAAGFISIRVWTDPEALFSMHYLKVPGGR